MPDRLRWRTTISALWALLLAPQPAAAQLHWDAAAEVGAMQRLRTGAGPGGGSDEPGPVGEVNFHLALLPMVRIGPYLTHDISPVSGAPSRQTTEGGLRAKFSPPLLPTPWRSWTFLGAGYARAYEPSHHVPATGDFAPGAGGGILDLRLGFGLGYRLNHPWELFTELGGRFGLAFAGSLYQSGECSCGQPYVGKDSFALSLSLGLSLNQ
jgi:hypothetical protein